MRNLILTGMMGAGKTTCGQMIAARLGRTFVDMDAEIVRREGREITRIFAENGEDYFRNLETALAKELALRSGLVIATGGGVILREENMHALRANGVVAFLNRPAAQIFASENMAGRPLAQGGEERFLQTFAVREKRYLDTADIVLTDFSAPENTVEQLMTLCKQWEE